MTARRVMAGRPQARRSRSRGAPSEIQLAGLQDVIESLIRTGKIFLEARFELPEREALQQAVQLLDSRAKSLIRIIEESGLSEGVRKAVLLALQSVLEAAFTIGSRGVISPNTRVAVSNMRADTMRETKNRRRREDPVTRIIMEVIERHPVGRGDHPYKKADIIVSEAQPRLKEQGHQLTDKAVLKRVDRLLKNPAL